MVDENDPGEEVRVLVTLQHSIQDAKTDLSGKRRIVSRRMQYVEICSPLFVGDGLGERSETTIRNAGYAPYLDYRSLSETEQTVIETFLEESYLPTDIEAEATRYAISQIVP